MRRREFITLLGGAAATWPMAAQGQQPTIPVIGFISGRSLNTEAQGVAAFHRGLGETGFVEGKNVAIEYRWADGQLDRETAFASDLIARQVAVIFVGAGDAGVRAVKAATSTTCSKRRTI